jgi:hypothetical protein
LLDSSPKPLLAPVITTSLSRTSPSGDERCGSVLEEEEWSE